MDKPFFNTTNTEIANFELSSMFTKTSNINMFRQITKLRFNRPLYSSTLNNNTDKQTYKAMLLFYLDDSLSMLELSEVNLVKQLKDDVMLYFLDPFLNVGYLDIKEETLKAIAFRIISLVQNNEIELPEAEFKEIKSFIESMNYKFFREHPEILFGFFQASSSHIEINNDIDILLYGHA